MFFSGFGLFGGAGGPVQALEAAQKFMGASDLAVETEFVAEEFDGIGFARDLGFIEISRLALVEEGLVVGAVLFCVEVGFFAEEGVVAGGGVVELAFEGAGFGADDAFVAPEGVGDFVDEVVLQDADRFELPDQRAEQQPVFIGVFLEVGGIDHDPGGMEAVGDGVLGDDRFAFIGDRPGGLLGVGAVGFGLFRDSHDRTPSDGVGFAKATRCDVSDSSTRARVI